MGIIVFTENHIQKPLVFVNDRQAVELVVPNDIIRFLQRNAFFGINQVLKRSHKLCYLCGRIHSADAVVPAGDNAQQLALGSAVIGYRDSGVPGLCFQIQNIF